MDFLLCECPDGVVLGFLHSGLVWWSPVVFPLGRELAGCDVLSAWEGLLRQCEYQRAVRWSRGLGVNQN